MQIYSFKEISIYRNDAYSLVVLSSLKPRWMASVMVMFFNAHQLLISMRKLLSTSNVRVTFSGFGAFF